MSNVTMTFDKKKNKPIRVIEYKKQFNKIIAWSTLALEKTANKINGNKKIPTFPCLGTGTSIKKLSG